MFGIVCMIIVCLLSLYIICSFYIYSRQGDLDNTLKGLDKLYKANDKDEIIKCLSEVIVQSKSSVRWPTIIAVSIVFSIFISYATRNIESACQKFIITFPLVFIPLYVSFNYLQAHGGNKALVSVGLLNSMRA